MSSRRSRVVLTARLGRIVMGATALTAVFGAVSGVGCAAFANGLRKLPPFSRALLPSRVASPRRTRRDAIDLGLDVAHSRRDATA